MNKVLVLTIALITFTLISGVQNASAQTEKTIQFAKGKSAATVTGETGTDGVYYNIRAGDGQKMTVTLTPKTGIGIKIEKGADETLLREEKGGTYTVYLETVGDFSIFLGSTNHTSKSYSLTVTITKMKDI